MNQLKIGIRTEAEHKKTVQFIKTYVKSKKKFPSNKMIFTHIAKDHIKENPKYYSKLRRARL